MTLRDALKTLTDGKLSIADLAALAVVLAALASAISLAHDRLAPMLDESADTDASEDTDTE